jgi:hypothetical protein
MYDASSFSFTLRLGNDDDKKMTPITQKRVGFGKTQRVLVVVVVAVVEMRRGLSPRNQEKKEEGGGSSCRNGVACRCIVAEMEENEK